MDVFVTSVKLSTATPGPLKQRHITWSDVSTSALNQVEGKWVICCELCLDKKYENFLSR